MVSGNIQFLSLSSALMCGITVYRNQPGTVNKLLAEGAYALTTCAAAIETVVAGIFCVGAYLLTPLDPGLHDHAIAHLSSSGFCVVWSIANLYFNLVVKSGALMADEQHVRPAAWRPFFLDRRALFHITKKSRGFQRF